MALPKIPELHVPILLFMKNEYDNNNNSLLLDSIFKYIIYMFDITEVEQAIKVRHTRKYQLYTHNAIQNYLIQKRAIPLVEINNHQYKITDFGLKVAEKVIREKWDRFGLNELRTFPEFKEAENKIKGEEATKAKATKSEVEEDTKDKPSFPLNLILYGPPGTGKTFTLRTKYFDLFTEYTEQKTLNESLQEFANRITWWEAEAIALLDTGESTVRGIISHELMSAKLAASKTKNEIAKIWATIQPHTVLESQTIKADRQPPLIFYHTKQGNTAYWSVIDENGLKEICPKLLDLKSEWDGLKNKPDVSKSLYPNKRYEFVTFHQSFTYEDFIEGIKPVIPLTDDTCQNNETSLSGSAVSDQLEAVSDNYNVHYKIEDGILKKMCLRASEDLENEYALFIDEINRGNVAQIFGELITLIEKDKREGMTEALEAKLPYSKDYFSVPPNLHIIGTMNSADRSVEALDTALRRRFSFVEMKPDYEVVDEKQKELKCNDPFGYILSDILKTINDRIEVLLDKDHLIGHSYFIDVAKGKNTLQEAFFNHIIPLLEEYFYGDFGKIELVLGKGFVETKKGKTIIFPECSDQTKKDFDDSEIKEKIIYTIKTAGDFKDDDSFIKALVDMKIPTHDVTTQ